MTQSTEHNKTLTYVVMNIAPQQQCGICSIVFYLQSLRNGAISVWNGNTSDWVKAWGKTQVFCLWWNWSVALHLIGKGCAEYREMMLFWNAHGLWCSFLRCYTVAYNVSCHVIRAWGVTHVTRKGQRRNEKVVLLMCAISFMLSHQTLFGPCALRQNSS